MGASVSSQPNPYQSPQSLEQQVDAQLNLASSSRIVQLLAATRPWVRLLSVLGFVLCGIMVLIGLAGAVLTAVSGRSFEGLVMVVYVPLALIYAIPSLYLFRYATYIRVLENSGRTEALERALEAQKSFWRVVGIITLAALVIYAAVLLLGAVLALVAVVR